jgi:hypothetical protein
MRLLRCPSAEKDFHVSCVSEVLKSLGVKATFAVSVAASIGVKLGLSAVAIATGVLMKNSIKTVVSVWCGVAFLRRPRLVKLYPIRETALEVSKESFP